MPVGAPSRLGGNLNEEITQADVRSLVAYAFIAVTCDSAETLKELIRILKEDNDKCQRHLDDTGVTLRRRLDVSASYFQLALA
jgi:hypothetical protein